MSSSVSFLEPGPGFPMTTHPDNANADGGSTPPRRARSARARWLATGGVLLVVGLAASLGLTRQPATAQHARTADRANTTTVGADVIRTGDIGVALDELGTVTPLANVTVKTQINGQLVAVGFHEGQQVARGDFLAQIDPRPFEAALEQANGTLAKDKALLAQAEADLKRFEILNKQDSISRQQVEDQHYLVAQDRGMVETDQGLVDQARVNLAFCHIVSPVTGRVGLRKVDPGNYVQTTDTNGIVVVAQEQPISVLFTVAEDDLAAVASKMRAGTHLTVEAYDRANAARLATGTLDSIDNAVDTTTGTVQMRAVFSNADARLFPDQFVNVRLIVDTLHGVLRVPVGAVRQGAPGRYVFVLKDDRTVAVRPVTLGVTDGAYAQVLAGLTAGDRVVTDGTDRLRDGAAVTVGGSG